MSGSALLTVLWLRGLKEFDATAPIVIASRDTLASKKRLHACEPFDLIVVDEAHHVGPDKNSRYRKILSHLEEIGGSVCNGSDSHSISNGPGYDLWNGR